ncbi:MAG TPA: PQQ-binding-like beta-propeller repeat protein, partial [Candidatus Wujingus californicus]
IYAILPECKLLWSFKTGNWVESSPAIDIEGTTYIGSSDGKLYAINPDGKLKWSFQTKDIIEASPAIGPDGTIYIGSNDKHLYAIGETAQATQPLLFEK